MKRFKKVIFRFTHSVIFLLLLPGRGYSENSILTLSKAIELALSKNPALKAAKYKIDAAKAGIEQARSAFFPRIDLSETYNRTNNPMLAVGNKLNQENFSRKDYRLSVLNDPTPVTNFNTQVILNQSIFDQGKAIIGIRQAKLQRDWTEDECERIKQEVIFKVIKAYYQVILAKEDLQVALESEETAQAHAKLSEDLFRNGQTVKLDLLSAKARLMEIKEIVTQARNGLVIAQAALNKEIGIDQNETFQVEGEFEYQKEEIELKDLVSKALTNRPDF